MVLRGESWNEVSDIPREPDSLAPYEELKRYGATHGFAATVGSGVSV